MNSIKKSLLAFSAVLLLSVSGSVFCMSEGAEAEDSVSIFEPCRRNMEDIELLMQKAIELKAPQDFFDQQEQKIATLDPEGYIKLYLDKSEETMNYTLFKSIIAQLTPPNNVVEEDEKQQPWSCTLF